MMITIKAGINSFDITPHGDRLIIRADNIFAIGGRDGELILDTARPEPAPAPRWLLLARNGPVWAQLWAGEDLGEGKAQYWEALRLGREPMLVEHRLVVMV